MRSKAVSFVLAFAAICALSSSPLYAQSSMLDRFDTNKDGKIKRSEIPEGIYRNVFDRMVQQYQLDPDKTYDRAELEKKLGATSSSDSNGRSGSSSRGRPSSPRSNGPRLGSSRSTDSAGKSYRPIGELPSEYRLFDKDGDGQIGLYEWPKNNIAEFLRLDLNDDGFLTISELKRPSRGPGPEKEMEVPKEEPGSNSKDSTEPTPTSLPNAAP